MMSFYQSEFEQSLSPQPEVVLCPVPEGGSATLRVISRGEDIKVTVEDLGSSNTVPNLEAPCDLESRAGHFPIHDQVARRVVPDNEAHTTCQHCARNLRARRRN